MIIALNCSSDGIDGTARRLALGAAILIHQISLKEVSYYSTMFQERRSLLIFRECVENKTVS